MILYTTAPVMVEPVPGFPAVTGGLIRGPLGLPIIIWYPGSPEYEAASILVGHTGDVLKEVGCRLKVPICGVPGRPAIDPARSSTATVMVMTAYVLDRWLDGPWMNSQNDQKPSDSTAGATRGLPPAGVVPPVRNPGGLREGPSSRPSERERGGKSLWDEDGGEWRYFPEDRRHNPHWDYNPHDRRNSPWQNIPIGDKPPRK